MRNEYYWFSDQPYKQYRLGIEFAKKAGKSNLYSAGVGAVSLALLEYKGGRRLKALRWAKKAKATWEDYFTAVPNYYNSHVWYARALGLCGDLKGMELALKRAAKLSGRPLSYQEFRMAKDAVNQALVECSEKEDGAKSRLKWKKE